MLSSLVAVSKTSPMAELRASLGSSFESMLATLVAKDFISEARKLFDRVKVSSVGTGGVVGAGVWFGRAQNLAEGVGVG